MSRRWSEAEKDELRRMRAAGVQTKIIARRMPGRNYCAVQTMIRNLNLPRSWNGPSVCIALHVSPAMVAEIDHLREASGQHLSALCRDALERGLAEIAIEHRVFRMIEPPEDDDRSDALPLPIGAPSNQIETTTGATR